MDAAEPHTLRPVLVLVAANMLFGTGLIFHAFLYNFYLEALHHPVQIMGHAAAALTGGGVVMLLPAGALVDRAGPKVAIVAAAAVLTIGLVSSAVVADPLAVYATSVLAGAGSGMWRVAIGPILMLITEPRTRARAFAWNTGLLVVWAGLGMALAGAISSAVEDRLGLDRLTAVRLALVLGAIVSAGSVVLFRVLQLPPRGALEPVAADRPTHQVADSSSSSIRRPLLLVGLVALWMLGPGLAAPFFNIFFTREHGLSLERVGFVFAAASIGWALAVLVGGEVAGRIGVQRALMSVLVFFGPAMWSLSVAESVEFAVALYFVQGVVSPVANPLIDQWLLGQAPRRRHGIISSWRQVAADSSAMIGASVGGQVLASRAFDVLFVVAGLTGTIGALGLIAGVHATRRADAPGSNG